MIRLRVVGYTDDHGELILSNKPRGKRGSHHVAIDQRLLDTLQEAVYAKREAARAERSAARLSTFPVAQSTKMPPREMQRLLRAGATTTQVAKAAEVDITYVEQFLVPVLYEQEGIVREAQRLYQEKPKLGPSGVPLGAAVAQNLAARHVRMNEEQLTAAWSATRQDGGPWSVTLTFPFRGRARTARWRFDPRTRTLAASNELARDIGWVTPGKRARVAPSQVKRIGVGPRAAAARKAARKKPARKKPARKKPARKKPARKKPARKKPARKKPARKKPARKKPARKKPAAKRKPVKKTAKRKPARKAATRRKPAARKTTRKPARKTTQRRKPARKTTARRKPAAKRTTRRATPKRKLAAKRVTKRKPAARRVTKRKPARRR